MAEDKRRRSPGIATLLSLLVPGLGHMYSGRLARGALLYAGAMALSVCLALTGIFYHFLGMCGALLATISAWILIAIDAALGAARSKEVELKPYNRWYFYVIIVIVFTFMISPYWMSFYRYQIIQAKTFKVPSSAMEPTLLVGDNFMTKLRPYKDGTIPNRGDLVVFPYPEDPTKMFIKRIVALEGERLEIRNKAVYINDNRLEDPWGSHFDNKTYPGNKTPRDNMLPVIIPKGCVFVMGDNRDYSHDSRFWGFVEVNNIEAKALYIYWSQNQNRIGKTIP
jgi:signal peptidase I